MLGLEPGASMDEIDDAYGDLQARYSPENGTMPDLEKMLEINEVYDRIRDSRRAQAA
jgi:curved DNA-binding protein CbpA